MFGRGGRTKAQHDETDRLETAHNGHQRHSRIPFFKSHRTISALTVVFTLTAFVLFLLVGLSLPRIKPIYLLEVRAVVQPGQPMTSIASLIRAGVWGICATSALNAPTSLNNPGTCYYFANLNYTIPPELLVLVGLSSELVTAFVKVVLVLLILHPVCAGLSFLVLVPSLFLASHTMAIASLVLSVITIIVSCIALAADLVLVIVARNKIQELLPTIEVAWGNGTWMVLAGVVCTWIAMFCLSARACYCCGVRRKHNDTDKY